MRWCSAGPTALPKTSPHHNDPWRDQNTARKLRNQSGSTKHGGVLATIKVWPAEVGVSGKVDATANLDGACARRQRAAMPERIEAR
jgi:hypothetical protein